MFCRMRSEYFCPPELSPRLCTELRARKAATAPMAIAKKRMMTLVLRTLSASVATLECEYTRPDRDLGEGSQHQTIGQNRTKIEPLQSENPRHDVARATDS